MHQLRPVLGQEKLNNFALHSAREIVMQSHHRTRLLIFAALLLTPALLVAVPYTFSSGQVISAAQINANFAALESELTALSSAATDRSNLIRISIQVPGPPNSSMPVITVPASATRPYLLRQVLPAIATNCSLLVNGTEFISLSTPGVGLSVPFSPGEVVTASCPVSAGGFTLVFEK